MFGSDTQGTPVSLPKHSVRVPRHYKKNISSSDSAAVNCIHPVWSCGLRSTKITRRSTIRAKLLTGTYTLQGNLSRFNQNTVDPTCKVCNGAPEDRSHFLSECPVLQDIREAAYQKIKSLSDSPQWDEDIQHIMQDDTAKSLLLLNPQHNGILPDTALSLIDLDELEKCITSTCYLLHIKRWNVLTSLQRNV